MKKILTSLLFAVSILSVLAVEDALTVKGLLQKADVNDGKAVFLTGKISDFEQKTSKKGNQYFVFKVKEGELVVNGYGRGEQKPIVRSGDKVEVRGIFRKSKTVGDLTFKNEIDVTEVKEKPFGLKKID